tara:strand:+ start:121 stop:258 length:138 start_codon:yes stop_codon:yes gene_type:complete
MAPDLIFVPIGVNYFAIIHNVTRWAITLAALHARRQADAAKHHRE